MPVDLKYPPGKEKPLIGLTDEVVLPCWGSPCCNLRLRRPCRVPGTENLLHREPHLLHALDLLLDDLLDVRVEVDGEREEDLEVGHAQVPLVVRQEGEELLLVPVQVDERLQVLLRRDGPPDPLVDRLQRDGAILLRVGVDAVLAVAEVDDPAELVRPLLGDVDPRGQVVPVELDLRRVSMPPSLISKLPEILDATSSDANRERFMT